MNFVRNKIHKKFMKPSHYLLSPTPNFPLDNKKIPTEESPWTLFSRNSLMFLVSLHTENIQLYHLSSSTFTPPSSHPVSTRFLPPIPTKTRLAKKNRKEKKKKRYRETPLNRRALYSPKQSSVCSSSHIHELSPWISYVGAWYYKEAVRRGQSQLRRSVFPYSLTGLSLFK